MNSRDRLTRRGTLSSPPTGAALQKRLTGYLITTKPTSHEEMNRGAHAPRARGRFEHFRDPLWFITMGMGIFFGLMAFLMALG